MTEASQPQESRVDRFVLQFVRDPLLWPVLIVVIAHLAAFVAPVLLLGLRDGRISSVAALLGLAGLSAGVVRHEWREKRRVGPRCGLLAAAWLVSIAAAYAADRYEIF